MIIFVDFLPLFATQFQKTMINYSEIFSGQGMDYLSYRALIDRLLLEGKATGDVTYDLHYTKMNVQRMSRVDKTVSLTDELLLSIKQLQENYKFLVITEGWCGDAAQIVPVFNKIATASLGKIELKFVLRDKNLPLIDAHLTNGGRAIPVLLVLDETGDKVLASWAPRPQVLQQLLKEWRKETSEMTILSEKLHSWYAKDKTQTTQAELNTLLKGLA